MMATFIKCKKKKNFLHVFILYDLHLSVHVHLNCNSSLAEFIEANGHIITVSGYGLIS
jgi:hypothetical protein